MPTRSIDCSYFIIAGVPSNPSTARSYFVGELTRSCTLYTHTYTHVHHGIRKQGGAFHTPVFGLSLSFPPRFPPRVSLPPCRAIYTVRVAHPACIESSKRGFSTTSLLLKTLSVLSLLRGILECFKYTVISDYPRIIPVEYIEIVTMYSLYISVSLVNLLYLEDGAGLVKNHVQVHACIIYAAVTIF